MKKKTRRKRKHREIKEYNNVERNAGETYIYICMSELQLFGTICVLAVFR